MNLTIRAAHRLDLAKLNRIEMSYEASFGYAYTYIADDDGVRFTLARRAHARPFERTYEWDWAEAEDFLSHLDAGLVWAAFDGEETAVGILELRPSEWNDSLWVQSLYVDKGLRRLRIGGRLIDRAVQCARERSARALFVETQNANGPAIQFYLRHGFRPCGLNDHHYSNSDIEHDEVAVFLVRGIDP